MLVMTFIYRDQWDSLIISFVWLSRQRNMARMRTIYFVSRDASCHWLSVRLDMNGLVVVCHIFTFVRNNLPSIEAQSRPELSFASAWLNTN